MNKTLKAGVLLVVAALLVLLPASLVLADAKGNVKGVVDEVAEDGSSLTLMTKNGAVTVLPPEGFSFEDTLAGKTIMAKGYWAQDQFQAETIREIGAGDDKDEDDDDGDDGESFQNAFCTGEKEGNHPLVAKIVARYGDALPTADGKTSEDLIKGWFCEGHSFGQIMLALTTHMLNPESDPYQLLQERKNGRGWGQIWKDKSLIGSEREGMPPGWVHKPGFGSLQENQNQPGFVPPGLKKKTPTP